MTSPLEQYYSLINFEMAGGIDPDRLERSLFLRAEPLGDGRARVAGGKEVHWVDLRDPLIPRCDCADHLWRSAICKHILAALLREGDPRVIQAVSGLVARLRERGEQQAA